MFLCHLRQLLGPTNSNYTMWKSTLQIYTWRGHFLIFNILIDYSNYAFSWSTPPKWQSLKRAYFSRINATSNYVKATFGSSWCTVTTSKCSLFSVIPYLNGIYLSTSSHSHFIKKDTGKDIGYQIIEQSGHQKVQRIIAFFLSCSQTLLYYFSVHTYLYHTEDVNSD